MNRDEFINELKQGLQKEDYGTVSEIINDYEEYFAHGLLEGKTEEEICKELGTPKQIIDNFIEQGIVENPNSKRNNSEKENNKSEANEEKNYNYKGYNVISIIGLAILNFFLVTVVAFPVGGAIFGVGVGFLFGVIPTFIGSIVLLTAGNTILFFFAISAAAFMLLVLIGIYFLVKWLIPIIKTYIKWNINVARGDY